jgi:hypothetical protein
MHQITKWLGLILLSVGLVACDGKEVESQTSWQAKSGARQMALIELFTSEGCGLCPAADAWMKQLPEQGLDGNNLVTLGFHIDYLNDRKGWVDPFGKTRFADRQRQLSQLNLLQSIFTPEFVVSGEVVHAWKKNIPAMVNKLNEISPEANISLQANKVDNILHMTAQVAVSGKDNRVFSKLYLAITEDNLISRAEGGDNAGHTFHHQDLVREWLGPFDLDTSGETEITQQITFDPEWKTPDLSLVAIVQNLDDSFVLQALNLPLY